jgi:hypothetical protein
MIHVEEGGGEGRHPVVRIENIFVKTYGKQKFRFPKIATVLFETAKVRSLRYLMNILLFFYI